jgi:hypothetical protein
MEGFEPIVAVAKIMAGFPRPWFVAGGWAIDLFAGRVTRPHEDLEVMLYRQDQAALREHLSGWELFKADEGKWHPWREGEWVALPLHQLLARRAHGDPPEFEFFLNEVADGTWHFRRDPAITRDVAAVGRRTPGGIPYIAPEVQLLYKARLHRPKDEHDFATARGRLTAEQRAWLKDALAVFRPGDPWSAAL